MRHPNQNTLDVAVVGGGPAGAITALCLARLGWRTGIFVSGVADSHRLGETLPPEINPLIRILGLWNAFLSLGPLQAPGIVSRWGSQHPVETDFAGNAYGCGWHIDRDQFDTMLCQQAVQAGANLFLNRRMTWTAKDGGWRAEEFEAEFLVNATGRHGMIIGQSSIHKVEDKLLSIVFRVGARGQLHDQRTFIETSPSGWWYSAPLPNGRAVVLLLTGAEIYCSRGISISAELAGAPLTRERLKSGQMSAPRIAYALSGLRTPMFGENWLAVGDSTSAYDPLSGGGILKALRHGQAAAKAIDSTLRKNAGAMERYDWQVQLEFEAYSRQRRQFYAAEHRWVGHPFWNARGTERPK